MREAQRHADYAYRLAVDPPAAKELRLFGLADWASIGSIPAPAPVRLQWKATRLRERPVIWSLLLVLAANVIVFWSLGFRRGRRPARLGQMVTFASAAVGTSMIAFGGLSWALDGAAAPGGRAPPAATHEIRPARCPWHTHPRTGMPAREIRFRRCALRLSRHDEPVLDGFDLTIAAGSSLAIVGQNGAGKTTLAKLLCRLYDPRRRDRNRRRRSSRA